MQSSDNSYYNKYCEAITAQRFSKIPYEDLDVHDNSNPGSTKLWRTNSTSGLCISNRSL